VAERQLPKLNVAGSIPVSRSKSFFQTLRLLSAQSALALNNRCSLLQAQ
jgi:hypothetical protein